MTYSVLARAPTRDEVKRRVTNALNVQMSGQTPHMKDRAQVERALHSFIDLMREEPATHDIVADAYGYIGVDETNMPHALAMNVKVYCAARVAGMPAIAPILPVRPAGTPLPPDDEVN